MTALAKTLLQNIWRRNANQNLTIVPPQTVWQFLQYIISHLIISNFRRHSSSRAQGMNSLKVTGFSIEQTPNCTYLNQEQTLLSRLLAKMGVYRNQSLFVQQI